MIMFDNRHGGGLPNGSVFQDLRAHAEDKSNGLGGQHEAHALAHMLPYNMPDFTGFHFAADWADHFLPPHFPQNDHLFLS